MPTQITGLPDKAQVIFGAKGDLALLVGNQVLYEGESVGDIKIDKIWDTPHGYVATISQGEQQQDIPLGGGTAEIGGKQVSLAEAATHWKRPTEPATTPAPQMTPLPTETDGFANELEEIKKKYTVLPTDTPYEAAYKDLGLRKTTMEKAIYAEYIRDKTVSEDDEYLQNLAAARHTLLQQKIHRWNEELELGIKTIKDDDRFSDGEKARAISMYLSKMEDPITTPSVISPPKAQKPVTSQHIAAFLKSPAGRNLPDDQYSNLENLRDNLAQKEAGGMLGTSISPVETTVPEIPAQTTPVKIPTPKSKAEYDLLPAGSQYYKGGKLYTKGK